MSRIHFMSDVHLEFLTTLEVMNLSTNIGNAADNICADYLVLAGDITTTKDDNGYKGSFSNIEKFIYFIRDLTPYYKQIFHIAGNHEFYHHDKPIGYAKEVFSNLEEKLENYLFLDNDIVTLHDGVKLAATTLWFSWDNYGVEKYRYKLNDFRQIPDADNFLKKENENALLFLKSLEKVDVIVTHHGVSTKTSPNYVNEDTNVYYYTDITNELYRLKPKYAIHGHMHESLDYWVEDTNVVTNPYGYNGKNPDFDIHKFIEV